MNINIKSIFVITLFSLSQFALAQKERTNWYFGANAGISFSSGSPKAISDGKIDTKEGCATLSNSNGELLFYTDGLKVWDRKHMQTPNGQYLMGHYSSSQSALIVPFPNNFYKYYIFTVDYQGQFNGLRYSEFDMNLNNGYGDIVTSKRNIMLIDRACEKLTSVQHSNGKDFWVLGHKHNSDSIFSFLVSSLGVSKKVVSTTGIKIPYTSDGPAPHSAYDIGYMKLSPDGSKVAYANFTLNILVLADFNPTTGKVTNAKKTSLIEGYGVEFSPNSKFLYVTDTIGIIQLNALARSESSLDSSKLKIYDFSSVYNHLMGSLQLGPDKKIYSSRGANIYLDVIQSPDSMGKKCDLKIDNIKISLGTQSTKFGLPNFVCSYFNRNNIKYSFKNICLNDSAFFWPLDTVGLDSLKWNFGDSATGSKNFSKSLTKAYHIYKKSGAFKIILYSFFKTKIDTSYNTIFIAPRAICAFSINDTSQCFYGHSVDFKNLTTLSSGSFTNDWNLGDGSRYNTIDVMTKGYAKDSVYKIVLTTKTNMGCTDSISKNLFINPHPKASFNINQNYQCVKWNLFDFNNSSTIRTGSINKTIWTLDKIDTVYTKDIKAKHYAKEGNFIVSLLCVSNYGCRDSISKTAFVLSNPKPSFTIKTDTQCFNQHSFDFINNTASSLNYNSLWDLGDSTASGGKDVLNKKYKNYGDYKILLITSINYGGLNCSDSITKTIKINTNPSASFTIDNATKCLNDKVINFTNQSSIQVGTLSFNWNLGDGNIVTTKDVTNYKYTKAGSYVIKMISISNSNCKDSLSKTVDILTSPTANFIMNDVCENDSIIFTNKSVDAESYNWKFGDGGKSGKVSPKYLYNIGGVGQTYDVTLNTKRANGCSDSITKSVSIFALPKSSFTYNINGNQVDFKAAQSGNSKYRWLFNNADSIVGNANPSHSYKTGMKVCLKVENAFQCISETCKVISISEVSVSVASGFKIYPNPNTGNFTVEIDNPEKDVLIKVYNAVGEMVDRIEKVEKISNINLNVAAGIYLVKVRNGEEIYTQKVSITK